jgi:autotransporter-associated beta strand protein
VTINTNGQISPGNSVGTLTVSNSLTFNGGGSYLWEITNTTAATPGVGWDLISVDTGSVGGGTLTIGSEGQFTVLGTAFGGFGFDTTANYTNDYFMIVRGNVSGSLTNLAFSSSGLGNAGNWSFSIGAGGTNLYLNYTAPFSGFVFTNGVVANQGDANLVTNNAAGAFAIIADQGGATSVTISNSAPLTFTNGANSYTGGTAIEQGVLVTTVDAGNGGGAFGTNAGNISLGSTNTGNTNAATLLIGADGVTVSKGVDVNAGGTGIRTIGATNSSGVATYSGNVIMNTNVTLSASNSSGTTLFTGVLSQSGAVTVAGAGTVTLAGANTFTNNVGIASGATLVASNNSALGGGSGTTTVSNGATLALAGNINEDEAVTIAGTGVGGNGALRNISGANTNTGAITLSANATIKAESGTRLSLSNVDITGAANRSVTFDGAGTNLVTGSISTAGGSLTNRIVKSGSGELVISNNGTTGTGQLRLGEGTVVLAAGSLTTSQDTGTRAIDIGLSGDAVGTSTAANATLLARSGVTVSNSIYVAPSGGDGSFTRTIGTDSTSGTVTYNNQMYLANTAPLQITSAGTANVVYSGNISNNIASESATITKVGAGSLTLSASNDWRGGFIAGAGTTILSGGNAIYDTNTVVVSNNATLLLSSSETIGSLAGAGTVTLGANSLVTGSNSASTTYSGVIGGTGGIFKAGTGTFTLAGANTYSGDTIVNAGTLAFSNGSVNSSLIRLGPDGSAGDATVLLSDSDGGTTVNSTFVVRPGGGNRSLVSSNSSGINTYAGSVYLDGGATISQQAAGVFALTGTEIDVKSQTLTLSSVTNGNVAVSSTIFDSNADVGNLVKSGNGTVTLTGANAYAGSTLISAGTLQVGDGGGSGQLGAGNVTNNASLLINRTGAITMGNTISGTGSVTLIGGGVLNITGTNNSYTGNTIISNGTVRISTLANSNTVSSIGVSNNVTLAGTNATNTIIDYTGGNVTTDRSFVVNGVATNGEGGTLNISNSATVVTLTGSASGTGKMIVDGGTLVLSNTGTSNSFAPGSIQVDSGATLQLAANNQIGDGTGLILNGGTFRTGTSTTGFSDTLGTLTLSASSTIDLGAWTTGVRQLIFANSNTETTGITWTGTLTITNWQGVAQQSSAVAEIIFGVGGLSSTQLSQVVWANQGITGGELIGGELVPVPEPRVYAAAIALLAAVGWRERKRLLGLVRRKR